MDRTRLAADALADLLEEAQDRLNDAAAGGMEEECEHREQAAIDALADLQAMLASRKVTL